MTTDPRTVPEQAPPHLTDGESIAVRVVAVLVAALGLLGFVNSFTAVAAAAKPSFGGLAPTVPIGIDLGIAVFAALDITLARLDMRLRWLRLIPWALTAATVWLNIAEQATLIGRLAHAVLPCLWVVAVEVAAHVVRTRAGLAAGTRMESIRASRWLLAPWPTATLWRRMVLWETRSYPTALARERARLLAVTDLQDTYGRLAWRWKAPRRVKALYRLGELAPARDLPALPAGAGHGAASPSGDLAASTAATPADTPPRPKADTTAGTTPAMRPAPKRTPRPARAARAAGRGTERARTLLADDPHMSGAELGRRLKVSERTGRRLRDQITTMSTTVDPEEGGRP